MLRYVMKNARDERGTAVLLALGFMVFLLALTGFAVDMAYQFTAIGEAQRSVEAAALAGAGKLGFDDTVFGTARAFARNYGLFNPYHNKFRNRIELDTNDGNASTTGNVVLLGVWREATKTFEPSNDGTRVNAVWCQWSGTVPTTFLRVIGIPTLPVTAHAVAISNPPGPAPENKCIFPIGLSSCPFTTGGVFTSSGCGKPIKFITSNGKADDTNTAAWVNLEGTGTPSPPDLKDWINGAAATCPTSPRTVGDQVGTNNGMDASVFKDALVPKFREVFNEVKADPSKWPTVKDSDGNVVYNGPGWDLVVPVIETTCNADGTTGPITGDHKIIGWTQFVITQAFDTTGGLKNGYGDTGNCAVPNTWDTRTWPWCNVLPPELSKGNDRSLFGYYACRLMDAPPTVADVPRGALGTGLRIVKTY